MRKLLIISFIFSFIVFLVSSPGKTPYDYFTRLGDAFLHSRFWLTESPPWLNELIPAGQGKYYVPYPPMPAILSIPFVFLFGKNFQQQYLAHIIGAGIVVLTMLISLKIGKDLPVQIGKNLAVWSGLLIGFGTIIWFLSSVGSVWYLGQTTSALFLLLAIYFAIQKKYPYLVGLFLGAAYLSRTHTIISLPFFLYFFKDNWFKNWSKISIGIFPFLAFDSIYNFIRFGVPWNMGYFLLPKVLNEENAPWFYLGVTNPLYIPDNLRLAFLSLPKFLNHFPFIQPSWGGLAIWITTPAFIYALSAKVKENSVKLAWAAVLVILLVVTSHGGTGSVQFGYRFAVDFYPILIFLTIKAVAKTGLRWHHWLLLILGIIVNLWGVVFINKFGWVSF